MNAVTNPTGQDSSQFLALFKHLEAQPLFKDSGTHTYHQDEPQLIFGTRDCPGCGRDITVVSLGMSITIQHMDHYQSLPFLMLAQSGYSWRGSNQVALWHMVLSGPYSWIAFLASSYARWGKNQRESELSHFTSFDFYITRVRQLALTGFLLMKL